jgi:hypothetical protein
MLSGDGRDLWELLSVRTEDGRELQGIGEECLFKPSLKRMVIPGSVRTIGRLSFRRCKNLDVVDFGGEVKLQQIEEVAFLSCSLKSIVIP